MEDTTENVNCLANELAGSSKAIENRPIKDKKITPNVTVKVENEIMDTTENVNCLPQCNTIAANEGAGSSKAIEKRQILHHTLP